MKRKTNYKLIAPLAAVVVVGLGCFIHSVEHDPHLTVYYVFTVLASIFAFAFGCLADIESNY